MESNKDIRSLISCSEFQIKLNDYKVSSKARVLFIIIGESIPTGDNHWGEAMEGFVAVIKKLDEKNIYHELAHLFGAVDHYDSSTRKDSCKEPNCIMQYGKIEGDFCSDTIKEIRTYISNNSQSFS